MPRKKNLLPQDVYLPLKFPSLGVDEIKGFGDQRPGTCADAQNVRAFEPATDRVRGGSRPGLYKLFPDQANGDYPIQEVNHLVTSDAGPSTIDYGNIIYAKAAGSGFGFASSVDGSDVALTLNGFTVALAGYALACSTWGKDGYGYVAQVKTADGSTAIYKISAAGSIQWAIDLPAAYLPAAGSLRYVAGMAVCGPNLFVATTTSASTSGAIHRIRVSDGQFNPNWIVSDGNAAAVPSPNSINCLSSCGDRYLGMECCGTGSQNQGFRIYDATVVSHPTLPAALKYLAWGGTRQNNNTVVVSDSLSYFYVIASTTTLILKKVDLGGNLVWESSVAGTPTGLCFDHKGDGTTPMLVSVGPSTPSVRSHALGSGALIDSADPNTVTNWTGIDSDNQGTFTVYKNSVASNDITQISNTLDQPAGWPVTRANASHYGASVNKGSGVVTPPTTASRQIRALLVSKGKVFRFDGDGTVAVTNGDCFDPLAPNVFSAQNGQDLYFVDGKTYKYYKASTNAITAWTPTAGTLPLDAMLAKARLICLWRARLVLAGLPGIPQEWFMSKQGYPLDWDTGATDTGQQAISAVTSLAGLTGSFITCLVPFTDDEMIFGCDHEIWRMAGDPAMGGDLHLVTDKIGMAWGRAWAKDDKNQIYFMSNQAGIYKMSVGAIPIRISQQIERRLENLDLGDYVVRLMWSMKFQGLHVFITPKDLEVSGEHYFWEARTGAWQPVFFGNRGIDPFCVHEFDGDTANDRVVMIGGRDGCLRFEHQDATDDDGTEIESFVVIGPLVGRTAQDLFLSHLQAIMGTSSADVQYDIYTGDTAEEALADLTAPVETGVWNSGRNPVSPIHQAGHAIYVQISSSDRWTMETITACYRERGKIRARA